MIEIYILVMWLIGFVGIMIGVWTIHMHLNDIEKKLKEGFNGR